MKTMVVVACVGSVLLAGCSGRSEAGLDRSASPAPSASSAPAAGSGLVLRTMTSGGIAGMGGPGSLPDFSLYGDGLAIAGSHSPMEYHLTPQALGRLLSAAAAAGLAAPRTVADPRVNDALYKTITFVVDGRPRISRIPEPGGSDPAAAFLARLDPATWPRQDLSTDPRPYRPSRVAVLATPVETDTAPTWPFAPLASGTTVGTRTCTVLTGPDVGRAERLTARQTAWTDHGRVYRVTLRPLLPDEADCTALT